MRLGNRIEIEIVDYNHNGKGLGKVDGAVVFTDGGFIGDRVLVEITKDKKKFFEGEIRKYIKKTKDREENPCPYGQVCGGCQFLGWEYQKELEWKRSRVQDAIERIGDISLQVEEVSHMEEPIAYRNHMQFHKVGRNFGLYNKSGKDIIPIKSCLMQKDKANTFLQGIQGKSYIEDFDRLGLRTNQEGKLMAIFVSSKALKMDALHKIVADAVEFKVDSLYFNLNKKPKFHYGRNFDLLYGEEFLEESLVGYNFQISPGSFFQINLSQAEKLVSMVKDSLNHRSWDLVMDLFCGIGSLSLPLSEISQEVIGVELNPRAIDDARQVAKSNGKNNLRYIAGKVENILPRLLEEENLSPQALVLDPPRAGVDPKALEAILESHPQRITYVSCNPSTLARDLKILKEKYRIEKITPLDMFPRTAHVEALTLLVRDSHSESK